MKLETWQAETIWRARSRSSLAPFSALRRSTRRARVDFVAPSAGSPAPEPARADDVPALRQPTHQPDFRTAARLWSRVSARVIVVAMCNDFGNRIPYSDYLAAFSETRPAQRATGTSPWRASAKPPPTSGERPGLRAPATMSMYNDVLSFDHRRHVANIVDASRRGNGAARQRNNARTRNPEATARRVK